MSQLLRKTRSVCPICLKNLPAELTRREDGVILLEKTCPEHGDFSVPVWQGRVDFDSWLLGTEALPSDAALHCPTNCGICPEHEIGTCCALLEVTSRCNLRCRYCFADGGRGEQDPSQAELKAAIRDIAEGCGGPLLQFSGGEPTLRDDLPELVRFADALERATIGTIESGKMTGDLARITTLPNPQQLDTEEFILAIADCLRKELA